MHVEHEHGTTCQWIWASLCAPPIHADRVKIGLNHTAILHVLPNIRSGHTNAQTRSYPDCVRYGHKIRTRRNIKHTIRAKCLRRPWTTHPEKNQTYN